MDDETFDDEPIKGTRTLQDIYQRCTIAVSEPTNYSEANNFQSWRKAMQEELEMINKNETWQLVE